MPPVAPSAFDKMQQQSEQVFADQRRKVEEAAKKIQADASAGAADAASRMGETTSKGQAEVSDSFDAAAKKVADKIGAVQKQAGANAPGPDAPAAR